METGTLRELSKLGAQSFQVGEITVTVISDGFLPIGADLLHDLSQEEYDALLGAGFVDQTTHHTGVNAFLIETGDSVVLVDSGTGEAMGPDLGHLGKTLDRLGVSATDVDILMATHLHPDHIGGAGLSSGNPFSSAVLRAHEADIDMWCSVEARDAAPDAFHPFFDLARSAVTSFGDRVSALKDGDTIAPGLTAVHLPGHTPGHTGVMVESGHEKLLIFADIVHVPPVQFANPDVTIDFDADTDAARATRKRVFDMVASDRLWIAGSHITFPALGHLERSSGDGYHFVPSLWQYA